MLWRRKSCFAGRALNKKTQAVSLCRSGAHFHPHEQGGAAPTSTQIAHFVPLDECLDRIDFLKLDLEGMEAEARRGAQRILREHRPHVFAECNTIANGVELITDMRSRGYRAYGCLVRAYNPSNFNDETENIFHEAMEFGLLFLHIDRLTEVNEAILACDLLEVTDADALATYLLRKPQYPYEVLRQKPQWSALGLDVSLFNKSHSDVDNVSELRNALDYCEKLARERLQAMDLLQSSLDYAQGLAYRRQDEIAILMAERDSAQRAAKERLRHIDILRQTIADIEAMSTEFKAQRDRARQALQAHNGR